MNDDSAAKLLSSLAVTEKWMRRVNQAAGKRTKEKPVADFDVGSCYSHFTMKVPKNKREMFAVLGWYFFNDDPFKALAVFMAMAEQNVPHTDGAVP